MSASVWAGDWLFGLRVGLMGVESCFSGVGVA
jgi:hypothetical protein